MGSCIELQETITVGRAAEHQSLSPKTSFAVVFKDDGETGYFYALDTARIEQPILDAMQIYVAASVAGREKPSTLQIAWSNDGLKAVCVINRYPHAVFDFKARRGYCRRNFPPPDASWTSHSHQWDDAAINLFR